MNAHDNDFEKLIIALFYKYDKLMIAMDPNRDVLQASQVKEVTQSKLEESKSKLERLLQESQKNSAERKQRDSKDGIHEMVPLPMRQSTLKEDSNEDESIS